MRVTRRSALPLAAVACVLFVLPAPAPSRVRADAGDSVRPPNVLPAAARLTPGERKQFYARPIGIRRAPVTWTASGGRISPSGLFTAGLSPGSFQVVAWLPNGRVYGRASVIIGSPAAATIDIEPGQDAQPIVAAAEPGTAFVFRRGIHRLVKLTPRDGQSFTGEPGAVLSGARLLTGFVREGAVWVSASQDPAGQVHGICRRERPRCNRPEDLFVDDEPQVHVAAREAVAPGTWHFDYDAGRIYLGQDPAGRRVELSVTTAAFEGAARDVTIAGLVVEKYAAPAQAAAINAARGTGWRISDTEVRFSHGYGVRIGDRTDLRRSRLHHNGQLGVGGIGSDVTIEDNEIAHNNYAGFDPGWEGGGAKFVATAYLVVRGNFVHHNAGPGLWTDAGNRHTLYERNTVDDNADAGIFHETSYDAVIRDNVVRRNGLAFSVWLWGAGILVAASPNVEVHGNTVLDNGNGIAGIQQRRGAGDAGPYLLSNLYVHDNVVRMRTGLTGVAQDMGDRAAFTERRNRFERNRYELGPNARYFEWMDGPRTESEWKGFGHDVTGTFTRQ